MDFSNLYFADLSIKFTCSSTTTKTTTTLPSVAISIFRDLSKQFWCPVEGTKKPNLLIEFSNSIFIKFYFKAYWCWTCIQNKSAYYVSSILSCLFPDVKRPTFFSGPLPPEPPPMILHEPVVELSAPRAPHLHFTTFENSIFVQKRTLVKLLE